MAARLEQQGYTVLFAYEEAIGFMFNALHKVCGVLHFNCIVCTRRCSAAAAFAEIVGHPCRAVNCVSTQP